MSPWQAFCCMQPCTAAATTPGTAAQGGTLSKAARSAGAAVGPTLAGRGPPLGLARVQTGSPGEGSPTLSFSDLPALPDAGAGYASLGTSQFFAELWTFMPSAAMTSRCP